VRLLLLAFALIFAPLSANAQSRQPPQPPAKEGKDAAAPYERGSTQLPLVVESVRTKADDDEAREQRDARYAQTWLAGVQIVLGVFTTLGLIFAAQSARAAKVSADVAKQALEGLERPYLIATRSGNASYMLGRGTDENGAERFSISLDYTYKKTFRLHTGMHSPTLGARSIG
jgi:hypothetical protein